MSCDRRGCEHIMCDRLSRDYGYICSTCFEELVESGPGTDIGEFMHSRPKKPVNIEAVRARYNVEFPYVER